MEDDSSWGSLAAGAAVLMLVSMMALEPATFEDLVEGAARQGLPLSLERARHLESMVHETAHALLLGIEVGEGMGPAVTARLDAMSRVDRDANEIDTLAVEVAVFRKWGFVGDDPPGFLVTVAQNIALATETPEVEELLAQCVMDQSHGDEATAHAREVIRQLAEWEARRGH